MRKVVFEEAGSLTLQDVVAFQRQWISNRPVTYCILSDIKALDLKHLASYGKVIQLSSRDIFGY